MNYDQTVEYLFTRLPLFSRIGASAYKADLVNTIKLCEFLGDPQNHFKSIHIAGTNGKGSVSHMLAGILQTAGYKTGLYTSPHLKDFRERIKVNGQFIRKDFVVEFTEKIKPLIPQIEPSFFEITVAMAFDYFKQEAVEVAVIETGLGGRLDSTNVVHPELSIITNIGMDHMNILGDSLALIANEKAGIIKSQVPVVVGEVLPETREVFEGKAKQENATLSIASETHHAMDWKWINHELVVEVAESHHTDHKKYHLDLSGIYQRKNLLTVLEACLQLNRKGWNLEDAIVQKALRNVKKLTGLHGRWEIIHQHPSIVLDVAHNEDGIRQLIEQIEVTDYHELHIVFGVVKDKPLDAVLPLLPKTANYYFTQAHIPRALGAQALQSFAAQFDLKGETYPDVNTAINTARTKASKNDLIIVCGSVFLVGEVEIS